MPRISGLSAALLLAASGVAQANVVPGLDGAVIDIGNLTYWGRRGPTNNGEVGMSFMNEMCNPGSVDIPWFAAMQPNHPFFGFIIARVHNDRIEQINEWSFCKHAWLSINYTVGGCGSPCNTSTPGNLMGVGCGDAYGAGNNANRNDLGPPEEIDPWLGEWNPLGSYFDIGDPMQAGYPEPADGINSLSTNIFDNVDNRCTVKEQDLLAPGAEYFYALQLVLNGESGNNRDDNIAHRGFSPSQSGGTWFFSNTTGMDIGTVLDRWQGASVEAGGNGSDDGKFYVAVKVTSLGGGQYHYEYAIHNVDNSRGGATFEVPIDANATATNFTFGDLDDDVSNDWTAARVNNRIVFSAPVGQNAIEWNTIYNFGFDADIAPGTSLAEIAEARPGAGAPFVQVQTEVPGGSTIATNGTFGAGCPGSTQISVPTCAQLNSTGGALNQVTSTDEYVYRVGTGQPSTMTSFSLFTRSTGGSVTIPARIYGQLGSGPAPTPIATTSITIGPNAGFYTATFNPPINVPSSYYIGVDNTPQTTLLSDLVGGNVNLGYRRTGAGPWSFQIMRPSWSVQCTTQPLFPTPSASADALPVLGTTYNIDCVDAAPSGLAVLVSGYSDTFGGGVALPAQLPNAPGCELLVSPDVLLPATTTAAGSASLGFAVPGNSALAGVALFHQWAVLDAGANQLGLIVTNGVNVTLGN
ncbi:MAG: hypothetical protein VYA51_10050 [Planctomycetota bacterium]|nr:hypothetical protein [Planctomycetota bacterium]